MVSSPYLILLIFLPTILILACASTSPEFCMMYSAYKLNKQGDNIQPWYTPFPTWNQSIFLFGSNYLLLTCIQVLQETGKMVWYSHLFENFPQFAVIHTVKGSGVVNKAKVDVFLEFSCFFYDPKDVGNLISGFSAFSKSILKSVVTPWKFSTIFLVKTFLVSKLIKSTLLIIFGGFLLSHSQAKKCFSLTTS